MRKLGSYLPGTNVGGAGVHWNGQTWRFLPSDFVARSHNLQRYGAAAMPDTMTIQDWGVTYDDLEPHYDRFERLCGISGKAGNLRGQIQPGGNPFEGPRSREYPNPPMAMSYPPTLFAEAAQGLGLPSVPAAVGQHVAGLHQPAGRAAGGLHLLRLLREVRLRQLLQGQRADDDPAGADEEAQLQAAHRMRGHEDQPRLERQARGQRHLRRRRRARNSSSRPT